MNLASNPPSDRPLAVMDLGRMPYARALAVQREINLAVSQRGGEATAGEGGPANPGSENGVRPGAEDTLLLVEHDPVITLTHRPGVWDHLLASETRLKEMGIGVEMTDRGGDVTYHGPGQLVAYPILQLKPLGLNLGSYMCLLEQVVIDVLAKFGISGQREKGAIGVWVQRSEHGLPGGLAKVCAMGVRVRKNTTMHGLALNVTTDMSHFQTIDPCGLGGRPVTSLAELLGDDVPGMDEVKGVLVEQLRFSLDAKVSKGCQ